MTNCVNCGAVLHGNKCDYCGTEYNGDNVIARFDRDDALGTLTVHGKSFDVYIGSMKVEYIGSTAFRTLDGTMHRTTGKPKHRFELIEV